MSKPLRHPALSEHAPDIEHQVAFLLDVFSMEWEFHPPPLRPADDDLLLLPDFFLPEQGLPAYCGEESTRPDQDPREPRPLTERKGAIRFDWGNAWS